MYTFWLDFNSGASVSLTCWALHQGMAVGNPNMAQGWQGWQMKKVSGWLNRCGYLGQVSIQMQVFGWLVGPCAREWQWETLMRVQGWQGWQMKKVSRSLNRCGYLGQVSIQMQVFGWLVGPCTREWQWETLMRVQGWQGWQMKKVSRWLGSCVHFG